MEVFNIRGELIMERQGNINQSIDVSHLNSGLYTVQVTIDGRLVTKKLMVQK